MKTTQPSNCFGRIYSLVFIFSLLFFFSFKSTASNYFWIGNGGNWSNLSHWATTSGGSVLHTQLPTAADDVFFDVNSFSLPGQIVHVDADSAVMYNFDWTSAIHTPTFDGTFPRVLKIYGSLTFISGMNMSFTGTTYFKATTTGQTIITAGRVFQAGAAFYGTGGEWTLLDAFGSIGISLIEGTLNTNDQTVTTTNFYSAAQVTRVLNMGASVFNISGNWTTQSVGITVNCGTSVINCTGNGALFNGGSPGAINTFNDVHFTGTAGTVYGNANFHDVDFAGKGTLMGPCTLHDVIFHADGSIGGINIVHDLDLAAGHGYTLGQTTINGSLHANGTCTSLISIDLYPAFGYINSSGNIQVSFVKMERTTATGSGTFTATNSIDLGLNQGWTFVAMPAQNLYWVGNGGNWSDGNHWSLTSGGPPTGCPPFATDNVFFDANSFSVPGQTVAVDSPVVYCKSMNWTGVTNTPLFDLPTGKNLEIHGSLTCVTAMNSNFQGEVLFKAKVPGQTITTAGHAFELAYIRGVGGEWTFQDAINCNRALIFIEGTVNTNNQTVNTPEFEMFPLYSSATLNMGSSVFNLSGKFAWQMDGGAHINCGTSVINCTHDTAYFDNLAFVLYATYTFYDINFTGNSSGGISGPLNFRNAIFSADGYIGGPGIYHTATFPRDGWLGLNNTFDDLNFSAGHSYQFRHGFTQTINNHWQVQGTCTDTIALHTDLAGSFASIYKATDSIKGNFLNIKDIHCTGAAAFMAYNSTDQGGNMGWNFSNLPPLTNPGPISGPSSVCANASGIIYQITSQPGAASYNWTVPPGVSIVSGQGDTLIVLNFSAAVTGDISVQAFDGCSLSSTASNLTITIVSPPTPTVTLLANPATAVCPGIPITFTATATGAGSGSITYDFKLNGSSVQLGSADTYISSTLSNGDQITCTIGVNNSVCLTPVFVISNPVTVQVLPLLTPAVTLVADPGTRVCPATIVSFTASASDIGTGTVNYDFTINGASVQNSSSNIYTSTVTNGDVVGCAIAVSGGSCYTATTAISNTISMDVDPAAQPVSVNAGTDLNITTGQTVQLNGGGDAGTYLWSPSTGLSAINILNPVASPAVTTIYTLTITNGVGCSASDDIKIGVQDLPVENCIMTPMNAITPNGDGINDRWIAWQGNCSTYPAVKVFNRYGTVVFESQHYQNDWQGTYKGKPLPDGTYYTITMYRLNSGQVLEKRNDLTILR